MRIKVVSDLHLEFSDINIANNNNCDVLILSGDIMIAEDLYSHPEMNYGMYSNVNLADLGRRQQTSLRFRDFLKRCSFQFPHVFYVAGNHEFYHGKWNKTLTVLKEECSKFPNIYFMECDTKKIDDITFVGSTLWTDMNNNDPITLYTIKGCMNDYRMVVNEDRNYSKLRPEETVVRHKKSLEYIRSIVVDKPTEKFVVIGHHAPSKTSIHPRYKNQYIENGAYSSDLSNFILDNPQIKLWTHGHVHSPSDYMVGSTRIICNPRGYEGYEPDTNWNPDLYIDL